MSKEARFYVCLHSGCSFKTEKRKAIYSHLIRAHNERKEDYECEYCTDVFQREEEIEQHLSVNHPDQDFTYTCLSRIENVIEQCARLGHDQRRSKAQTTPQQIKSEPKHDLHTQETNVNIKRELVTAYEDDANAEDDDSSEIDHNGSKIRTKASVNASLNNIAKVVENTPNIVKTEPVTYEEENVDFENDTDSSMFLSKPSGLKIKLNLKKIAECSPSHSSRGASTSPPLLERHPISRDASLDSSDFQAVSPPEITQNKPEDNVSIREKASKYFDPLEVYHSTDANGMRCCPFCTYKTTKNTIRVHLSGIHKIYFVKCSLCDYKAAFPHQITQHGVKFHKTTNLNVIQLSKESREKVIATLPKSKEFLETHVARDQQAKAIEQEPIIENDNSSISFMDDVISSGSGSEDDVSMSEAADEKQYKPPKCQTSKTDYYNIKVENGVYLYCCKLCPFQTPVRSTIYTHKYKHEDKTYRCAYCNFTSSPRSNVVHHCRTKHKFRTIAVYDVGHEPQEDKIRAERTRDESQNGSQSALNVKQEPIEEAENDYGRATTFEKADGTMVSNIGMETMTSSVMSRSPPTIIKVPQFKRTFPSGGSHSLQKGTTAVKKRRGLVPAKSEYKWSLNKMYRINPTGTPRYMCAQCPYACDTHPKMKHHLYRHRPQQYKCPYCDHRKYPRSYVVRHVRDTHRGKPLRVIDLGKGVNSDDTLESQETQDGTDDVEFEDEEEVEQNSDTNEGQDESTDDYVYQDPENSIDEDEFREQDNETSFIKSEPNNDSYSENDQTIPNDDSLAANSGCQSLADRLNYNLNKGSNDRMFSETPDVSPNFSETVYTSTPIIESIINNGQFPSTPKLPVPAKLHEKKKSAKDYRINAESSPKYICNKCNYGTDNYKTIHNHMYRHESQRYQCPYCGYRRSPRSFVENHIREVHKGNPVIVTELTDDLDTEAPIGSPRQCVNLKRKEPVHTTPSHLAPPYKTVKGDQPGMPSPRWQVKWPAPKPASKVNLSVPKVNQSPAQLHIPVKQKSSSSRSMSTDVYHVKSTQSYGSVQYDEELPDMYMADQDGSTADESLNDDQLYGTHTDMNGSESSFKEGNRTTFKTMYKCVFDPETCNHISKDKSKMKQHLFMHVEYRPWSCDLCEMTASQSSHIKNHVRTEHPEVSEMSFKYKKHNYLEKHIESFLTKGLFTVPVNEYRKIMDMKGTTKQSQKSTFARDLDGFVLCPYCNYKTKSGGMTDHVKMRHMHPRFKCHWCDYKAFYRSEIRKHHRKEKSHLELEFKTQELDLSQMLNNPDYAAAQLNLDDYYEEETNADLSLDTGAMGDYGDQDWSSQGSSPDHSNVSTRQEAMETDTADMHYTEQSRDAGKLMNDPVIIVKKEHNSNDVYGSGRSSVFRRSAEIKVKKGNKFKCGYCSFSASLRVKVKMHCSKKHAEKLVRVIEPLASSNEVAADTHANVDMDTTETNVTRVDAKDWKGTKFEQDLRNAGVSRLNLASLFPKGKMIKIKSQKNSANDDEPDFVVNTKDKEKVVEYTASPNHLTIPFKKAPARKRIEIPLTRTVKNVDNDNTFKIPFAPLSDSFTKPVFPVSCTRVSEELPKVALRNIKGVDSDKNGRISEVIDKPSVEIQEEFSDINEIESDIIVEPLGGVGLDADKEYGNEQIPLDADLSENVDGTCNMTTLQESLTSSLLQETLAPSDNASEHVPVSEQYPPDDIKVMQVDKSERENNDKLGTANGVSDSLVHTTYPNSTPVVLENESAEDEEDLVKDIEDYNVEEHDLVKDSEGNSNECGDIRKSEDYTVDDENMVKESEDNSVDSVDSQGVEKNNEEFTVVLNTEIDVGDTIEDGHTHNDAQYNESRTICTPFTDDHLPETPESDQELVSDPQEVSPKSDREIRDLSTTDSLKADEECTDVQQFESHQSDSVGADVQNSSKSDQVIVDCQQNGVSELDALSNGI